MNNRIFNTQHSGSTRSNRVGQPSTIWQADPRKPSYTFVDGTGKRRTGQIRDRIGGKVIMEFGIGGFVCTRTLHAHDITEVQS